MEEGFEDPILDLERRIEALSGVVDDVDTEAQREQLNSQLESLRERVFSSLSAWQTTLVARNAKRPYTLDYVEHLVEDFQELHGDRRFSDDPAIVSGFGTFRGRDVMLIGHQKGRTTKEKIRRNFGMPRPEGYRKALRTMHLAEKFGRPILTFIDTPGAYPGIGAEERGQAEAIAFNLREMAKLTVPVIVTVTGEGGSGGALALGVGNRVNILEHAIYSVISPEGCAAILWRDASQSADAAKAMRLTAADARKLEIIDGVIDEPVGGAHRDHDGAARAIKAQLLDALSELGKLDPGKLQDERLKKYLDMGDWTERR